MQELRVNSFRNLAKPRMKIELSEKQQLAFYSPATEVLYGGAAGGGKSLLLRISAIRWCEQVPGVQVYFFRRTFPELRDNHLRGPTSFFALLAGALARGLVRYNKQENEFIWVKTGSRISLCHCQYEGDVERYQGAEIHVLIIDELTLFTEYMYRFLRSRVRAVGLPIPAQYAGRIPRIECGSNPGNIGHSFVKRTFRPNEAPFQNKIWHASKTDGGMMRQFIPAKLSDNATMLRDDPNYESRLDGLGSKALVQAMKDGDWDIYAGQFFDRWNREIHVLPKDFEIPKWWEKFCGYDHGFTHPYVWGAYAVDGDGNIIKFAESGNRGREPDQIDYEVRQAYREALGLRGCDDPKILKIIDQEVNGLTHHAGHDIWAKHHIQMKFGGREIVEQFREMGLSMIQANIDRKTGWSWMRSLLDWRQAPDGVITKRPKLFIRENCWRTINCIPQLQIDENDPEDVLKVDATDQDVWAGDDPADETRYAVMSRWSRSEKKKEAAPWGTGGWFLEQLSRQGVDIDLPE